MSPKSIFLSAEWRNLILANYVIDPNILEKYIPHGTELDMWKGNAYVSLVGFLFLNTKIKGIAIPFHQNFEEVNLRFYVKYRQGAEWRRGVVFIKEIVPRSSIAIVANRLYKEHYIARRMQHQITIHGEQIHLSYKWKNTNNWNSLAVVASSDLTEMPIGSDEEFITEHYWGYTRLDSQKTAQYEVQHPRWQVHTVEKHTIDCDFAGLYGKEFNFLTNQKPASVFLAAGSPIVVRQGEKLFVR